MNDAFWMRRALRLAAKGFTPPNPMVGCVLVRDGRVVGEGYHTYVGQPHAEAVALRQAGDGAVGATAYVTLEPCSHWGRTPPCADALIRSRVHRVVAAVTDPDPRVSGRGLERLREAGIAVEIGVLEAEARRLNEAFFHFQATHTPFVILKSACTLDGKTATRTGNSQWITGETARNYAHRLRARSGAVLVGIGTVLADDPRLTARLDPPAPRQPLRIILDSRLRTPPDAAALSVAREDPDACPLLIVTTESADSGRESSIRGEGVDVLRIPADQDGRIDLTLLMAILGERQITSLLVDGGGEIHAGFLAARLAQKALFFLAPKIVGGKQAPTAVEGRGVAAMSDAIVLNRTALRRLGTDFLIEAYFVW